MVMCVVLFDLLCVVDIGDVLINLYNLYDLIVCIEVVYWEIIVGGCCLIGLGGDYIIMLFILCVLYVKYGCIGLIYVDVYVDVNDIMFGEKIVYGMLFCCVVEEGFFDCNCVV